MKNLARRALPALASLLALWLAPAPAAAQPCVSCYNESCPQLGSVLSPCAKPVKKAPQPKPKKKNACPPGEEASEDTDWHCCFPGQYWDWDNASCEGEPTTCPAGRLPVPTGCAQPEVLGFGGWRIYVAGSTAYLAYEGSPTPFAAAFFGSSNGWWYLRTPASGDVTVFTDGSTLDGGVYGSPWTSAASVTPTAFHDFTLTGDNGLSTSFHDKSDYLEVDLSNGARLFLVRRSPIARLQHRNTDALFPKGATWPTGVALPAGAAPVAPAPTFAATPPVTGGAFGAPQQTYAYGGWSIRKRANGKDVDVWWSADPRLAAEFIGDSNGWFHYRAERETMVWSQGPGDNDDGSFYERPWEARPVPVAAASGSSFSTTGTYGLTTYTLEWDRLVVRTTDGGMAEFPKDSPAPRFVAKTGKSFALRSVPGLGAAGAPVAAPAYAASGPFGAPTRTFTYGGWSIRRRENAKDIDLWWTADAHTGAEFIGDSNGWFHYRADRETMVWSQGPGDNDDGSFYERPWTNPGPSSPASAGASFSTTGSYGETVLRLDFDRITVRTTDGGIAEFPKDSPTPRYVSKAGKSFNLRTAGAVAAVAAPSTPLAAAASPSAFGTTSVTYAWGGWAIRKRDNGKDIHVWWAADPRLAAEFIGDSNGWWHYRADAETIVWSQGPSDETQNFYERPWTSRPLASPVSAGASFSVAGQYGSTSVSVGFDKLAVRLIDGGVVEFPKDSPTPRFVTRGGSRFDLKRVPGIATAVQAMAPAPATPARTAPVAPIGTTLADGGPEQAFKAGGWQLYKPAGSGELFLWFGAGDAALCVGQDTNGWFYWRKGGKEEVVYSNGDQEPQGFLDRPWETRTAAAGALPAGGVSIGGMYGTTRVTSDGAKIVLSLVDGAKVELSADAPTATFRSAGGAASVLP